MDEMTAWILLGALSITVLFVIGTACTLIFSRKSVEKKYALLGGGVVGGFDAVLSPTAFEAAIERDRQTKRTAPAPSPGDPPWAVGDGRIRIDL